MDAMRLPNCSNSSAIIRHRGRSGHHRRSQTDRQRHRPVFEAQNVMACWRLISPRARSARESLRLAAHVLEYDPELRCGAGYARARELLDSGVAAKQMHKIIRRRAISCNADIGNLRSTLLGSSTVFSRRSIAADQPAGRNAGAPIDKAPASRCSRRSATANRRVAVRSMQSTTSQFALARAGAKADAGILSATGHLASAARDRARATMPAFRCGGGARLAGGSDFLCMRSRPTLPDQELRVTVGQAKSDDAHLLPRCISPMTSC